MKTIKGPVTAIVVLLVLCVVSVAVTLGALLVWLKPSVETDPRFPHFHETFHNGYKVTTDTQTIRKRFSPLGVDSGISVAASRTSRAGIPDPEPQHWYHAVLTLDEPSRQIVQSLPMSESAPLPALHPELFDDVPQDCTLLPLNVGDEPTTRSIEEAVFTRADELRMFLNAGAYCPEKGLLLVDAWGVSGK